MAQDPDYSAVNLNPGVPQVDYRQNPSYGGKTMDGPPGTYDRPIEPQAYTIQPPENTLDNPDNAHTYDGFHKPTVQGWSPDSKAALAFERRKDGSG